MRFRFPHLLRLLPLVLLFGAGQPLLAQEFPLLIETALPEGTSYASDVPTPVDVLGHVIGSRHTAPHEVVAYFRAIEAVSDRVVVAEHGRTYEGRPLIHAVVTSPENHARLEAIRTANLALSADPSSVSDAALAGMPAVVYQGFSVHGNEASGTEAGVLLLYHLAAGSGPAVDDVLDRTVIVLDPMLNPDGRDRFTDWANRNRGGVPTSDPQDREHNEPWPGGRTNHYWFDLNRDWLPVQLPESKGRLDLFYHWRPQVLTDHHEMGGNSTFFFQPGIPARNNPNTPQRTIELTGEIAAYHGRGLDRIGSLYYSGEDYDDFYYGKGSTYPDVNGAIGILFEQASSRSLVTETSHGDLHYAFTIRNQFSAALSTLEAVADLREDLLRNMRDFYASAPEVAGDQSVTAHVFGLDGDRSRALALAEVLLRHDIRVYDLAQDLEVDGRSFRSGAAFVVPMNQPQVRLINGMMERRTTFEDSLFYDISAWTFPLAFGVSHAEFTGAPAAYLGEAWTEVRPDEGERVGGDAAYGYVLTWDRYFAPRALYRLQAAGLYPRLIQQSFTAVVGGQPRTFPRGSIFIPNIQRDVMNGVPADTVHALVDRIVADDKVRVFAIQSGITPEGPDLGSPTGDVLERPRIALLTGPGAAAYEAGEVWHLLTERFRIPVSLLDVADVADADLSRYNTLVLAGGGYNGLPADKVGDWVRGGGRLIALTSAVSWLEREDLAPISGTSVDTDSLLADLPYDQIPLGRGAQYIGGAIFEARLDTTHPLANGYGETVPVFVEGTYLYTPSEAPGTTVGRFTDAPLMSGYIAEEQEALLRGGLAIGAWSHGRGRIMAFTPNPNFRAFWYGTNGLFLNAIFFGGSF